MRKFSKVTLIMMMFVALFTLVSCGAQNLEEYAKSHKNFEDTITKQAKEAGYDNIEVKGNLIIITWKSDMEFSGDVPQYFKDGLEANLNKSTDVIKEWIKSIEEATGIDDVRAKIVIVDAGGKVVAEKEVMLKTSEQK